MQQNKLTLNIVAHISHPAIDIVYILITLLSSLSSAGRKELCCYNFFELLLIKKIILTNYNLFANILWILKHIF